MRVVFGLTILMTLISMYSQAQARYWGNCRAEHATGFEAHESRANMRFTEFRIQSTSKMKNATVYMEWFPESIEGTDSTSKLQKSGLYAHSNYITPNDGNGPYAPTKVVNIYDNPSDLLLNVFFTNRRWRDASHKIRKEYIDSIPHVRFILHKNVLDPVQKRFYIESLDRFWVVDDNGGRVEVQRSKKKRDEEGGGGRECRVDPDNPCIDLASGGFRLKDVCNSKKNEHAVTAALLLGLVNGITATFKCVARPRGK